jgi:hypothetical protein
MRGLAGEAAGDLLAMFVNNDCAHGERGRTRWATF